VITGKKLSECETPLLFVDRAVLAYNISEMSGKFAARKIALRPHIKTHKCVQIAKMQMAAGARGITCARLSEAEVFADAGFDDIFVAYPAISEAKLQRVFALMQRCSIILSIDSTEAAIAASAYFSARKLELPVRLEVDTGLARCGFSADDAVDAAQIVADLPGIRLQGIFTHEGHAGAMDSPDAISTAGIAAGKIMIQTGKRILARGLPCEEISVGSTPTAALAAIPDGVTEARPGTYVFYDTNCFARGVVGEDRCALRILATVIARPAPDRIVIDAGTKEFAGDRHPVYGYGRLAGLPDAHIERAYEEHGIVRVDPECTLKIGDRVEILPVHVCPAVNLWDKLAVVDEGVVTEFWLIAARGKVL